MHTQTQPKLQSIEPKKKERFLKCTNVHIHFHGKSRVFYAQSSSQMIRKQGKPDEREKEGETRRRNVRLDCGEDPFSRRKNIIALMCGGKREKERKLLNCLQFLLLFAIRFSIKA